MNKITFKQICENVLDNFNPTDSKIDNEEKFLHSVHKEVVKYLNLLPRPMVPYENSVSDKVIRNIQLLVSAYKIDFVVSEILEEYIQKLNEKYMKAI